MNAVEKLKNNGISFDMEILMKLVYEYKIKEISVFGSSIRDDFNERSDIDLLLEFRETGNISLFDLMDIEEKFKDIFGRNVDIVEPAGLRNPIRRKNILDTKEVIYAA